MGVAFPAPFCPFCRFCLFFFLLLVKSISPGGISGSAAPSHSNHFRRPSHAPATSAPQARRPDPSVSVPSLRPALVNCQRPKPTTASRGKRDRSQSRTWTYRDFYITFGNKVQIFITGNAVEVFNKPALDKASKKYADARSPLRAWCREMENGVWKTPVELKERFPNACMSSRRSR